MAVADELEPHLDAKVAAALDALGRTEDVRLSPDRHRLAVAGFGRDVVAVLAVALTRDASTASVAVDGIVELTASGLDHPHGVDWLDDDTLVVANRDAGVVLLPVPASSPGAHVADVSAVSLDGGLTDAAGPGSLSVLGFDENTVDVLVCRNWGNVLTRLRVERDQPHRVVHEEVWLRRLLDVPDGVAVSPDGRWVAVSNHNEQVVLLYDATEDARPDQRAPSGVLRGITYPHGLRFTADGRHLLVADAGAPVVHVFEAAADGGWGVTGDASAVHRVVDDATFHRGRTRPDEGGPKGIDIDLEAEVVVVTCEERPLAFFDLRAVLAPAAPSDPAARLSYEVAVLDRLAATKAELAVARHDAMAAEVREHDARAEAVRAGQAVGRLEREVDAADARVATSHDELEALRLRIEELQALTEEVQARADDLAAHLDALHATKVLRSTAWARDLFARARRRSRRR